MLVLIQIMPAMSPWWYYGCHASTGLLNWFAIALSALSDVLPPRFRAPGIGILLAGFLLGFSLAPIFALLLTPLSLSIVSLATVTLGLVSTILFVPETLPPSIAQFAKEQHRLEELRDHEWLLEQEEGLESSFWATSLFYLWFYTRPILRFVSRPFREMSILNRNTFFRLISTLAFFSGMVSSGDQVLLVYYLQERLDFTTKDVSVMFFIMGTLGLFAQGVLLKPLNDCIGEKWVVALAFFVGAVDNTMYGLATNKATIFTAVALSSITGMAFPTISAIKANNVEVTEQGRIQGALYSLQALASGLGPVLLRLVYTKFRHSSVGPGAMFIFAASLYLVAVAVAYALPADRANTQRLRSRNDGDVDHDDDIDDEGLMDFDELLSSTSSASIPEENSSVGVYGSLL
jgi:MFS transporter, DHA1 family, tetracycline resistance protein